MQYTHTLAQECQPSSGLMDYIESYWWMTSDLPAGSAGDPHTCIPKGTIEFIIHLDGEASEVYQNGKWQPLYAEMLVGIHTVPVTTRMRGRSSRFGIRLKPEAFIQLFGVPLAELYQNFTSVSLLAGSRFNWLFCLLREAPDMESRVTLVESFLYKKLMAIKEGEQLITRAIRKIWLEEGNISTSSLSRSVHIGERQLQRLFKSHLGISPKLYSRIIRFRSAYEQAQAGKNIAWTDVAYNLGYADQAHFVKDFKNFAGVTPTALFN